MGGFSRSLIRIRERLEGGLFVFMWPLSLGWGGVVQYVYIRVICRPTWLKMELWRRIALEDIQVYEAHKANVLLRLDSWRHRIEREERQPTLAESDMILTLEDCVVEYDADIKKLREKVRAE